MSKIVSVAKGLGGAINPMQAIQCIADCYKISEIEKTKRVEIREKARVQIKKIESQREDLLSLIDESFKERRNEL